MNLTVSEQLSPFVLGFWRLKKWQKTLPQLQAFVEKALSLGIYSMDHAYVYGSEAPFGKLLKQAPALRSQMQIISKCGINAPGFSKVATSPLYAESTAHYRSDAAALTSSVDSSLQALQTDYIDMLLLHRPDYLMDYQQIAEAFTSLKQQGKVRALGVSNFTVMQQQALQSVLPEPLFCNQVEVSPYHAQMLDSGLLEYSQQQASTVMAWSCLAGGELFNQDNPKAQRLLACLQKIQQQMGAESVEQVVYAWVRALPIQIHPITGTGQEQRLQLAVDSVQLQLSYEQWYEILQASRGKAVD